MNHKITKRQIKAIWALAHRAGFDEAGLHARVAAWVGKRSIRHLTRAEAARVIEGLSPREGIGKLALPAVPFRKGAATRAQMALIGQLCSQIGWDQWQLLRLAHRMYRVQDLRDLKTQQASGVIEALKAIRKRQTRRGVAA